MSVPPESVTPPASSAGAPPPPASAPTAEERQWAMFAHLSALLGGLVTGWIGGWGWFLGPLIIWLMKKDSMPLAKRRPPEVAPVPVSAPPSSSQMKASPEPLCSPKARMAPVPAVWSRGPSGV